MKKLLWFTIALALIHHAARGAENVAANAINSLGIDLLRQTKADQNTVLSPYSIQCAMAMAYEGADGTTRAEMAKALHYEDDGKVRKGLSELRESLYRDSTNSQATAQIEKQAGYPVDPFILTMANRLFGQTGYNFRPQYLSLLKASYGAPFEALDFRNNPASAAEHINSWVGQQTHDRIRDLVSADALNVLTRLVLVNAIYLKAAWIEAFSESATERRAFHASKRPTIQVLTMVHTTEYGYGKFDNVTAVTLSYAVSDLQFLILLPDSRNGIEALQRELSAELLAKCADLKRKEIVFYMPKFKLEPPLFNLKDNFATLGMKQAFDIPVGSANFDRIAPRKPNAELYISDIFHKAFVDVDEKGTEAAAATVIAVSAGIAVEKPKPIEVRVDHPFLFAIQHRETGACLFIGRVNDPSKN